MERGNCFKIVFKIPTMYKTLIKAFSACKDIKKVP